MPTNLDVELKDVNQNCKNPNQSKSSDVENGKKLFGFKPILIVTEIVGLLGVFMILYREIRYANGFGFSYPTEFNWHPFLMSLGPIYLLGNGLLVFKILPKLPKEKLKIIHTIIHGTAFFMAMVAVLAAYVFHLHSNIPNFYSMHSWVGLITIVLLVVQGGIGAFAFLFPIFGPALKTTLRPYHEYLGNIIFVLAIAAAISGINERAFLTSRNYALLPQSALLLNYVGVLFIIYAILVQHLSTNRNHKRYTPGENADIETKFNS